MQINASIYKQFHIKSPQMPKIQDCRLGKWKKTEHDRFMKALSKYGKNWTLIQKAVKTRTLAQVRSHSQKLFLSMTPKEINLFEEEINRRFESFCSMKKKSELSKQDQKSNVKVEFSSQQREKYSEQCGRSNHGFNCNQGTLKINEEQKKDIQDIIEEKKDVVKVESSTISSPHMIVHQENYKSKHWEENMAYNFVMVPYPQMMPQRFGNFPYIYWLPS